VSGNGETIDLKTETPSLGLIQGVISLGNVHGNTFSLKSFPDLIDILPRVVVEETLGEGVDKFVDGVTSGVFGLVGLHHG
jgi:hypothetical protein